MDRYIKKTLRFENIIIYGEGVIGKKTLQMLQKLGIKDRIKFFAKSERKFQPYVVDDIEVKSIYDLQPYFANALFLLAVSDQNIGEIKIIVEQLKIKHWMVAKKLYADSYKKCDFVLRARAMRNYIYKKVESKSILSDPKGFNATHITYCIAQNAGDTVLSWCVRKFLQFSSWNIKSVVQKVDNKLLAEINASDALVIGGGGLFLPDTNPNAVSGWQWAVSNKQIQSIRVPIVIFSVGYNYFKNQENTQLFISSLNCIVRQATFVGLRNKGSVEAVKRLVDNELKNKIEYQPCITTLIRKIYKVQPKRGSKLVAFNVAFDREECRYGNDEEEILNQLAKTATMIKAEGFSIVYVAHCDEDLRFLSYLNSYGVKYKVKNLTQSLPSEVIQFYRKMEVVIGMRGHAQMIPFGIGVKIISLGTHDKMKWFLQDVNLEDCYVDLNSNLDKIGSRIINIFRDIVIDHPEEMDVRLQKEQEKLWKISCENKDKIIQALVESKKHELD